MHYAGKGGADIVQNLSQVPTDNMNEIICGLGATPMAQHRCAIALKSHVAWARYLKAITDTFVEVILRFDRKAQ